MQADLFFDYVLFEPINDQFFLEERYVETKTPNIPNTGGPLENLLGC